MSGRRPIPTVPRTLIAGSTGVQQFTNVTDGTETTVLTAAVGQKHTLTYMLIGNADNAGITLDFRDATAGAIIFSVSLGASVSFELAPPQGITQTTANANWTVTAAAGANADIFVQGTTSG